MLCARFISFHKTNLKSSRSGIQLLTNLSKCDQRTTYGRNIKNIAYECDKNQEVLTKYDVKKLIKFKAVPDDVVWRAKSVDELLGVKYGDLETNLADPEIDNLLNFICTS